MFQQFQQMKKQAVDRVTSFQQRLKINPKDAEALHGLSISYRNGWGGLSEDEARANFLLKQAAHLGHPAAVLEYQKMITWAKAKEDQSFRDAKDKHEAKNMFDKRQGLRDAIEAEIFPCVVSIKTVDGIGTGFFQHSLWLVSNAHVLPSYDSFDSATLTNSQVVNSPLAVERAFHRPSEQPKSPDVVIVNVKSRPEKDGGKGLGIDFSGDEAYKSSIFFYVYFDPNTQAKVVKYLVPRDLKKLPWTFNCEDGGDPQFGCSGSPVIQARVIIGKNIQWEFRVVGMVYARSEGQPKLLCVIPVRLDFKQIQTEILSLEEDGARHTQMADSHRALDQNAEAKVSNDKALMSRSRARNNFQKYIKGVTVLDISLPEGLEKLIGSSIIELSKSELLNKNKYENSVDTLEQLIEDLLVLFKKIRDAGEVKLYLGNSFFESTCFRVDVVNGANNCFKLDLQDNTGKGRKVGSKSASSVFAIVNVSKTLETVNGETLARLFEESIGCTVKLFLEKDFPKKIEACHVPALVLKSDKNLDLVVRGKDNYVTKPIPDGYDRKELSELFVKNLKKREIFLLWEHKLIKWIMVKGGHLQNFKPGKAVQYEPPAKNNPKQATRHLGKMGDKEKRSHEYQNYNEGQDWSSVEVSSSDVKMKGDFAAISEPVKIEISQKVARDDLEIPMPADGDCLFSTIFIGYLLPVVNSEVEFLKRLKCLIGDKGSNKFLHESNVKNLMIIIRDHNIKQLFHKGFKAYVLEFRSNMGLNNKKWGSAEDVKILSDKLKMSILMFYRAQDTHHYVCDDDMTIILAEARQTVYVLHCSPIPGVETQAQGDDACLNVALAESASEERSYRHFRLFSRNPVSLVENRGVPPKKDKQVAALTRI